MHTSGKQPRHVGRVSLLSLLKTLREKGISTFIRPFVVSDVVSTAAPKASVEAYANTESRFTFT